MPRTRTSKYKVYFVNIKVYLSAKSFDLKNFLNVGVFMQKHVRAVVIGGGVVGVGTLYHLAEKGWTDSILLERKDLTSGSTWHAAGLLPLFNMSYSVGQIHKYSVKSTLSLF